MNKEYWLERENLCGYDISILFNAIRPKLVVMERDNQKLPSNTRFSYFLSQAFTFMWNELEKELETDNLLKYAFHQKIMQFMNYGVIINECFSTLDDAREVSHTSLIYDSVEQWWIFQAHLLNET